MREYYTNPELEEAITDYLNTIGETPLLTHYQEISLARRIRIALDAKTQRFRFALTDEEFAVVQTDGNEAFTALVKANTRLVVRIASMFARSRTELFDYIQFGNKALIHAAKTFDGSKNFKFSSYATPVIRRAIIRGRQNTHRSIRVPVYVHERLGQIFPIVDQLSYSLNRRPSSAEITTYMKALPAFQDISWVTEENITLYLAALEDPSSLEKKVHPDETDSDEASDYITDQPDFGLRPVEYSVDEDALAHEIRQIIIQLRAEDPDAATVLEYSFGLGEAKGKCYNIREISFSVAFATAKGQVLYYKPDKIEFLKNKGLRFLGKFPHLREYIS